MCHKIKWSMLFSLRVQICLLSSVEFLCFVCQNGVVSVSSLEVVFCKSHVCFSGVVVLLCDAGLVD